MTFDEALSIIGLTHAELEIAYEKVPKDEGNPTYWNQLTAVFHAEVKKAQRAATFECHPDRCKDANATDRTAVINNTTTELLKMQIRPRPRTQPPTIIFHTVNMQWNWGGSWADSSATSTSTTGSSFG